ncbi:hypothetical protein P7C70_g3954, partial [Phenoliferia sp. Uapishka_3]
MTVTLSELSAGQHAPVAELIQPYEAFPKVREPQGPTQTVVEWLRAISETDGATFSQVVEGPTLWKAEEFKNAPEKWQRTWSAEQLADLEDAYTKFEATGLPLTAITKESFPLSPSLTAFLREIRSVIVDGQGFILIQGLPTENWPVLKSSAIYLAIGTILGYVLSQNGKGHVLGHVKDLGNDPTQIHKVRIYSTNARQFFHTDASDIVGLLCLHKAQEGGESDVVSAHNIWNTLQAERPDVAKLLATPNWYFDRKGEVSEGLDGWVKKAVFYYHDGHVISHYDPYFVKSIGRHVDAGLIPGHSQEQLEAVEVLEQTAAKLKPSSSFINPLHLLISSPTRFVADTHVFHARTAYTDFAPPAPRRHLLRLWLSTPVAEGGWKRPFPDSDKKKRGGIQVNSQPETCPLDGE